MNSEHALERVLARDAIREVLAAYARGVDRTDAALLASCYFPDAIEEHGSTFTGNAHEYVKSVSSQGAQDGSDAALARLELHRPAG